MVKTTNELDAFAIASRKAAQANKPINVKIGGIGAAKVLADIQRVNQALKSMGGGSSNSPSSVKVVGVEKAINDLAKFTSAMRGARADAQKPIIANVSMSGASGGAGRAGGSKPRIVQDLDDTSKAFKFTASEGLNFSRQMADIGVTAAMGMNPLMIALQQGPQLFDILQTSGARAGVTIGAAFRAAGASIYAAMAPLLPLIAGIAAVAGTIAAGFALGAREINKANGDIVNGLGLTEKQLDRVKKSGVDTAVTMGDTFFAFFDVVGDRLATAFEGPLASMKALWNGAMDAITAAGNATIKYIIGGFVGGVRGIAATWRLLPAAIADAISMVGNKAIDGIEWIIIKSIQGINWFIEQTNAILGTSFSKFSDQVKLGRNKVTGAGADFAGAFGAAFMSGINDTGAALDSFWSDISRKARERREKAIREAGGDAENAPKGPKTEAEKFADIVGDVTRNIAMIEAQTKALELSEDAALQMTNQQKLLNDAQDKGITLTDRQRAVLIGLAEELTAAQIALRKAENLKGAKQGIDDQNKSFKQAMELVGLYGEELYLAEIYQTALNKATNNGKDSITELAKAQLLGAASTAARNKAILDANEFMAEFERVSNDSLRALDQERGEIGLSGAALEAYRFEQDALNEAIRRNIVLSEDQKAAIRATAKTYGDAANTLKEQKQARENAIGLAHDVASIIGGAFGRAASALVDAVSKIEGALDGISASMGKVAASFSKGMATGGAFGAMTGSATGGAIGGGLGQIGGKAIAGALGKLGKFAGPLGAIAGGLLGGIIGGMLKKTPKASATVSIIAGEAMETAITGNKSSLKKIAGGMADSVIAGLAGVAETLGADLAGNAKVSIGIRKKSYRVDETGRGRTKKGAGVQDFGEDQASAIAYAIQVAIKQGVLDGLSDSMNRLIVADGDLQAQLQKALSFKSVFDELAQKDDPAKWAQDAITKWHDGMAKIFAEAGATASELAELERLTGLKRADAAKAAADALEEASRAAFEKERPRRELEIQIMELTGRASQALAATRAMELEQMDASLRPLQERVNTLKDQAAATEAAATLEAGRLELLKELWAEQGRESVLRLHQLQAMDESYRAIQLEIWALQDQKKAAEELAAAQQKIAEEARGLQDRIDQLTGNTVAIRERELAAVDASNRALVQRIHALEDEAAAAAKAKAIADEADGLQSRWLQLIGDTAALRERELSALDPTNRALMSRIFAEEDRQAAEEKARAAAEEYTNSLRETVSGLSDMAQRIRDIAQEIREYKASLTEESAVAGNGYARTLAQFQSTSRMAALGNENSLSSFIGDAQAFLASAKENARSSLDYRRAIGMVSSGADSAIGGANALAASADAQAAALNATIAQTEVITSLGGSTVDLLAATNAALTDVVTPAIEDTIGGGIDALRLEIAGMRRDATERRDEEKAEAVAMVTNISAVRNILDRVNRGDSLAISLEDLISVLVANTTAQPVPTSEVV